jgi:ribosomal protein S18 acetylase RimI-like enzyme
VIRERHESDLDELVSLATRVEAVDNYPGYLPDRDFVRFLTRPEPVAAWVAVRDDVIVGHVALSPGTSKTVMALVGNDAATYVARLLVDPDTRRSGIGRALLDHACRAGRARGRPVYLDVIDRPEAAAAIALYRAEGWQEIGRAAFTLGGADLEELVFRAPT